MIRLGLPYINAEVIECYQKTFSDSTVQTERMIFKPCSRQSTARGPCLCNISWIQPNFTSQEHNRR